MNCPDCGAKMEYENAPMVQYPHPTVPSAHYRCDGCDSEWVWFRKQKLRKIDGAIDVGIYPNRINSYR